MERPRTGHPQHQTGSITVVDLIRRTQGPVRIPSADEAATDRFVNDLLGPAKGRARHRGRAAKAAKLVSLAIGSTVLCGSVIVASTFAHHHTSTPTVGVLAAAPLTGAAALRPDTLKEQLSGSNPAPAPSSTGTASKAAGASADLDAVGVPDQGSTPATGANQPSPTGGSRAANVVREFYRLVGTQPAAAEQLVVPSLLSSDSTGFVRSWNSMQQVSLESVQTNSDGTVQAVVRMLQQDGTWLRVVELLHVTSGATPRIDGAELLSAQRG